MPYELPKRRNTKAFTLAEFLIVIAIIAGLAALFLPAIESIKARGQSAQCANNLRQIGAAFQVWVGDRNGVVKARDYSGWIAGPDGTFCRSWVSNLNPYLMNGRKYDGKMENTASVFRCPVGKDEEWNGVSYAANLYLGGFRDPELNLRMGEDAKLYNPRRMVAGRAPTKCVIVVDGKCKSRSLLDFDPGAPQTSPPMALRHNKTVNALFADGHVENLAPLSMPEDEYHAKVRWNYGSLWPAVQ